MIAIDGALCGLPKHVALSDAGTVTLLDARPPEADWVGPGLDHVDPRCLRTLLRLEGEALDLSPPACYANVLSVLGKDPADVWGSVHPSRRLWWAQDTLKAAKLAVEGCDRRYHRDVFTTSTALFDAFRPFRVDASIAACDDAAARTFEADADGWVPPPTYDRFGTRTGRLTVVVGPRVLTAKASTRAFLRPTSADYVVVSFDFAALEARVALALAGKPVDPRKDPYDVVASVMGSSTRDDAKAATYMALYSDPTVAKHRDPNVSKVRRAFKLGETFARLKHDLQNVGKARNAFGRVILEPEEATLYSNHVQSTGADVSLLGFLELTRVLEGLDVVPHFLIHDAMFASVAKADLREAQRRAEAGVTVSGFDLPFPIKATLVEQSATV